MAKSEYIIKGDFDELLNMLHSGILSGSVSASFEDGSSFISGGVRCAVRVYERYSMLGENRVSLTITLFDDGEKIYTSGITAGGSQAKLFKINTIGEESFLSRFNELIRDFQRG